MSLAASPALPPPWRGWALLALAAALALLSGAAWAQGGTPVPEDAPSLMWGVGLPPGAVIAWAIYRVVAPHLPAPKRGKATDDNDARIARLERVMFPEDAAPLHVDVKACKDGIDSLHEQGRRIAIELAKLSGGP